MSKLHSKVETLLARMMYCSLGAEHKSSRFREEAVLSFLAFAYFLTGVIYPKLKSIFFPPENFPFFLINSKHIHAHTQQTSLDLEKGHHLLSS